MMATRRPMAVAATTTWLLLAAMTNAAAQSNPPQGPRRAPAVQGPKQAAQPARDSAASPQRVAAVPTATVAPTLTQPFPPLEPQAEAALNRLLADWEAASARIKTLSCEFWLFEYDEVFNANQPKRSRGELKYEKPDKGLYRYQAVGDDGAPHGEWIEHWICDGKSIFEFNTTKRELIERPLPPQLQGEGIANGPLPFLFNAKAETLKQRYWLRLLPPGKDNQDKVMLQAFPKYREDAANFQRAQLLLWVKDLSPYAVELYLPNGKDRNVHLFDSNVVNDPLRVIKRNFLRPRLPAGWKKVIDDGQPVAQAPSRVQGPAAAPTRRQ